MKAQVNKIIENTFIDGPGSRMAIFLQGCNMKCLYCHNPETQNLCNGCGICVEVCPKGALKKQGSKILYDKSICRECDLCIKECPNFSFPKYYEMDVGELYNKIVDLEDFLDGITISGGECTLQYDFMYELFKRVKANTSLTTFIDTNGFMDVKVLQKLCTVTDGFMFDLKAFDRQKHIELTGVSNEIVLENIKYVSEKGLLYEVRTVVVEGFTNNDEEIIKISSFIKELNDYTRFKIIPFRPNGVKTFMADYAPFDYGEYERLYNIAVDILKERTIKSK
jgi:pyruvate formate lyase activating enzyme